jgi:hypothetical protein
VTTRHIKGYPKEEDVAALAARDEIKKKPERRGPLPKTPNPFFPSPPAPDLSALTEILTRSGAGSNLSCIMPPPLQELNAESPTSS